MTEPDAEIVGDVEYDSEQDGWRPITLEPDEFEITDEDRAEWAREAHKQHPAKFAQCPDCNLFSAAPWSHSYSTMDGTFWSWGGICKTHGAWSESS